jgi:hypothetical protein
LISLRERVAQLYPQALGSIFIASYDSKRQDAVTLSHFYKGNLT